MIAQRLVRTLCPTCRSAQPATPHECQLLGLRNKPDIHVSHAKGCTACAQSGYRGRSVVAEVLRVSHPMRDLVASHAPLAKLRHQAFSEQCTDLVSDGTEKVLAGSITLDNLMDTVDLTERM